MKRTELTMAALIGVATVVLVLSDTISEARALPAALFALFFVVTALIDPWMSAGTVVLDQKGFLIRRRMNTIRIPWVDVETISVASFCEEKSPLRPFLAWLVGSEANRRLVKVALKRSLRLKLLPSPSGTRALGVPSRLFRTVGLYVEDPDRLVEAARSYLKGAR